MEITKKSVIISVFGTRKKIGKSTVSLNLALELAKKNYKVIFGNSFESDKDFSSMLHPDSKKDHKTDFQFLQTKIDGLRLLTFSEEASRMTPDKIDDLLVDFPEKIGQFCDFLIFNVKDPFSFPDRYILLKTDIHIMVARTEPSVFLDLFQHLEKMVFLPVKPAALYLIFNYTRDIDKAFETYLQLMKQALELNINIKLFLLGTFPNDILRLTISNKLKLPISIAFPNCPSKGAAYFLAEKIIQLAASKKKNIMKQPAEKPAEDMDNIVEEQTAD